MTHQAHHLEEMEMRLACNSLNSSLSFDTGLIHCSMFCCTLLYDHSDGERELVALLNLSSWCLVMVKRLFLAVPWGCLRFVIVVFPDYTHLLFLNGFCTLSQ